MHHAVGLCGEQANARTAKPCGPGRRCYGQALAKAALASTGAVSANFAGRGRPERTRLPGEHGISRQPTVQGRPCVWLHLYAAVQFFCVCFRTADRGCQPAPGLPCALLIERVERPSRARAKCAARTRRCVRKCGIRWAGQNSMTVTLRCAPSAQLRRWASLEGRRPSCIPAVHPSRLAAQCRCTALLAPQDDGANIVAG